MSVPEQVSTIHQHVVSKPEPIVTTHHESYVRPVQTTTVVEQRPVTVTQTQYVQPTVTTRTETAGYTSSYKPMPSAKTSNYKFQYHQPKEFFHPEFYPTTYNGQALNHYTVGTR